MGNGETNPNGHMPPGTWPVRTAASSAATKRSLPLKIALALLLSSLASPQAINKTYRSETRKTSDLAIWAGLIPSARLAWAVEVHHCDVGSMLSQEFANAFDAHGGLPISIGNAIPQCTDLFDGYLNHIASFYLLSLTWRSGEDDIPRHEGHVLTDVAQQDVG